MADSGFTGSDRFEILGRLGRGGMGVVYEAYDRRRGMRVALKTLRRLSANRLLQFKREFRTLSQLSHPNIIRLYELVAEGRDWFFTMEVIDGNHLVAYVKGDCVEHQPRTTTVMEGNPGGESTIVTQAAWSNTTVTVTSGCCDILSTSELAASVPNIDLAAVGLAPRPIFSELVDVRRLRKTLGQLAEALNTLHLACMVHRDLKPSNVLVTHRGRVVLMDFGLVAELDQPRATTMAGTIKGTPAFMAPEQVRGEAPTAAADWYAFGVILYQLLANKLPFDGTREQIMAAKQNHDPPRPSLFTEGIPAGLETLCLRLLSREAPQRASYDEVLDSLGLSPSSIESAPAMMLGERNPDIFVGRDNELNLLHETFTAVRNGEMRCVLVTGPSGMGKTSLFDQFLSELTDSAAAGKAPVVLSGRCHERESLAYKAFDGVLDQLSHYLMHLSDSQRRSVLPNSTALLVRLFPTLRRVPDFDVSLSLSGSDPLALRNQAVMALRELFCELGRRRPIIIRIEDLQWADRDSLALLGALLASPLPASVLLIATLRREATPPSECSLHEFLSNADAHGICQRIALGPLSHDEQRVLLFELGRRCQLHSPVAEPLWREAGGHPMLLAELAWYAQQAPLAPTHNLRLEDILWQRVTRLSREAQCLVEMIAVAGEPMPLRVLAEAAGLSHAKRERALAVLRANKLAHISQLGPDPWLDIYHDKVRETVIERLASAEARLMHRQLSTAIEAWGDAPVALLARQWLAAGDRPRAVDYLLQSAHSAAEQLAVERASELYGMASELLAAATAGQHLDIQRCQAWIGLAEGLRITDQFHDAVKLLGRAQVVASAHGLIAELADIHYLRGSLCFPRGDIEGCLDHHTRALAYSQQAGSSLRETRSLSGLGDAQFMRGHMAAAYEHYDHCIRLCREYGFFDIEAANLSMRGMTCVYQNQLPQAMNDGLEAVRLANEAGNRRAAINARVNCLGYVWLEMGHFDRTRRTLEEAVEMAHQLGTRRFEAGALMLLSQVQYLLGQREDANALITKSVALCRETGLAYVGPMALGVLAYVTDCSDIRRQALEEAQNLLDAGAASYNYLHFYRMAMDMALEFRDFDTAHEYADKLEAFGGDEPLPWIRFFVARTRILISCYRGQRDPETLTNLGQLYRQACEMEFYVAAQALGQAVSYLGPDNVFALV